MSSNDRPRRRLEPAASAAADEVIQISTLLVGDSVQKNSYTVILLDQIAEMSVHQVIASEPGYALLLAVCEHFKVDLVDGFVILGEDMLGWEILRGHPELLPCPQHPVYARQQSLESVIRLSANGFVVSQLAEATKATPAAMVALIEAAAAQAELQRAVVVKDIAQLKKIVADREKERAQHASDHSITDESERVAEIPF